MLDSSIKALRSRVEQKLSEAATAAKVDEMEALFASDIKKLSEEQTKQAAEQSTQTTEITTVVQSTISEYNDRITATEKNVQELVERANQRLDSFSDRVTDMNKKIKHFEKTLDLMSSKLQEFENISVDVEEVEKSFVTKSDMKSQIADFTGVKKGISNLTKTTKRMQAKISDIASQRTEYALKVDSRRTMEDVIDLKSRLLLKSDFESMNDRIDNFESKVLKKSSEHSNLMQKLEENIADVLSLKKTFVSKEQFNSQRKEIRLLISGLKGVQRLKDKIKKLKLPKGKSAKHKNVWSSIVDLFVEN